MESMLVTEALDTRDFLCKKIRDAIKNLKVVNCLRIKDFKMHEDETKKFIEAAKADYQSITDMIARYHRLNVALVQANATTMIKLSSGREMTRAEAIALRKSMISQSDDFTKMVMDKLESQFAAAHVGMSKYAEKADKEAESYKLGLIQRDGGKKELSEDEINMVSKMTDNLYGMLIDPIEVEAELEKMHSNYDNLLKEIDTALKISNATTYVEF